jgi:hypothetical protein
MKLRVILQSCLLLSVFLLALGCFVTKPWATAPMASIQQDSYAKSSICPINKTAVYIYRLGSSDRTLKTLITVDNKEIAHTVFASYLYLQLNPGSHEIIAHTEYWSYDKNTKHF